MEAQIERFGRGDGQPLVSIVVLNCNGANWLPKCFETIKTQTIVGQIETIMVDNNSSDDSVAVARKWFADFPWPPSSEIRKIWAFAKATIPARARAKGRWLLFLNNDTWLEPDCMEKLIAGNRKTRRCRIHAARVELPGQFLSGFWILRFRRFRTAQSVGNGDTERARFSLPAAVPI